MFQGTSLRALREQQGLRRVDIAKRSGVSLSTVTRLESGLSVPNIETLVKLANAIGVPFASLLFKIGIVHK